MREITIDMKYHGIVSHRANRNETIHELSWTELTTRAAALSAGCWPPVCDDRLT